MQQIRKRIEANVTELVSVAGDIIAYAEGESVIDVQIDQQRFQMRRNDSVKLPKRFDGFYVTCASTENISLIVGFGQFNFSGLVGSVTVGGRIDVENPVDSDENPIPLIVAIGGDPDGGGVIPVKNPVDNDDDPIPLKVEGTGINKDLKVDIDSGRGEANNKRLFTQADIDNGRGNSANKLFYTRADIDGGRGTTTTKPLIIAGEVRNQEVQGTPAPLLVETQRGGVAGTPLFVNVVNQQPQFWSVATAASSTFQKKSDGNTLLTFATGGVLYSISGYSFSSTNREGITKLAVRVKKSNGNIIGFVGALGTTSISEISLPAILPNGAKIEAFSSISGTGRLIIYHSGGATLGEELIDNAPNHTEDGSGSAPENRRNRLIHRLVRGIKRTDGSD